MVMRRIEGVLAALVIALTFCFAAAVPVLPFGPADSVEVAAEFSATPEAPDFDDEVGVAELWAPVAVGVLAVLATARPQRSLAQLSQPCRGPPAPLSAASSATRPGA